MEKVYKQKQILLNNQNQQLIKKNEYYKKSINAEKCFSIIQKYMSISLNYLTILKG
jgi:hypothetical protein